MCRSGSGALRRRYKSRLFFVDRQLSYAGRRTMRGGAFDVAEQPFVAGGCDEKIFGDVKFVPLADLDGFFFDEPPAFEGVHGMTGEMSRAMGLHLEAKIARAEAGVEGFEVDDRQRQDFIRGQVYFIRGQIARGFRQSGRLQERNVSLRFRFHLRPLGLRHDRR